MVISQKLLNLNKNFNAEVLKKNIFLFYQIFVLSFENPKLTKNKTIKHSIYLKKKKHNQKI